MPLHETLQGLSPQDLRSDIAANLQRIENGRVNEIVHESVTGNAPTDYSKFIASFGYDISYRYLVRVFGVSHENITDLISGFK